MVKVEVYGDIKSTCTQRILILLEELNLKYTLKNVDLLKGEHKNPEFVAMQPFGKVPVIKYDDRIVYESRSIMRYISKYNLELEDFLGGSDVDMWLEVESQNYNPHASKIVYELVFKKWFGEKTDDAAVKHSVAELEKVLDVYEKRLSEVPYIAGENYSIADMSHIPYTNHLLKCGFKDLFKSRPHVYKWLKRIIKRDNVQYVLSSAKEGRLIDAEANSDGGVDVEVRSKHRSEPGENVETERQSEHDNEN